MSAETLRRAASLMRERAEAASAQAGPEWSVTNGGNGIRWIEPAHIGMHGYGSTAEHIASWQPAVALAVADWLDQTCDAYLRVAPGNHPFYVHALAVARAYLGETA